MTYFPIRNYRKAKGAPVGFKWAVGAVTLLLIISFLHSSVFFQPTNSLSISSFETSSPTIPNIVHFVHLLPEAKNQNLKFTFRQFISVYSALYYLNPDKIYIHTNSDKIIDTAKNSTDPYLRVIANLPNVVFSHQDAPNHTTSGLPIRSLAHRADFVRTKVLKEHGGIYLDDDVYILKDLSPLRHMGFENVVGMQKNNEVCNAVLLCAPGNEMIVAYDLLEDRVFDGSWDAHSIRLLTTLHAEYSAREKIVLSLPQDAFFPGSWERNDLAWQYQVFKERGVPVILNHDTRNQSDFIASFQPWFPRTWQRDWRASYTMHGWNSALRSFTAEELQMIFGIHKDITLEYVLAQTSNFARAVFPAVNHAIMNGVIRSETRSSILAAEFALNELALKGTMISPVQREGKDENERHNTREGQA